MHIATLHVNAVVPFAHLLMCICIVAIAVISDSSSLII